MHYKVTDTATVLIDHHSLDEMIRACGAPDCRAVLLGFNEYSKHMLNLIGDKIVAIYDPESWKIGISFRGIEVMPFNLTVDANLIVVCDIDLLYDFTGKIRRLYENKIDIFYPSRLHYKSTVEINVFEQDRVYSTIKPLMHQSPPSMMQQEKLFFLAELMRVGLKNQGGIIEMGVYQAGSAWYMAHVLNNLGENRKIYLFDVFETHMMHPNATMCNEEIKRRLEFYPHCVMLEGLVDNERLLSQVRGKPICFAHYDLGFHVGALEFLWEHLQPGSPLLLDNYGHTAINPWDLDDFFAARGAHVARLPWSEQGIVFKTHGSK
jgi:predicted O-methyltransferase YrrM